MQTIARPRSGLPDGLVVGALGLVAVAAWLSAVLTADMSRMNALGLVSVLGPAYWVAVVCVVSALVIELARPQPRPYALTALVVITILVIYGSAPAIEPIARNPTSWTHVGFVSYIAQHGTVLTGYDARFSWPGMFALAAVVDAVTGQHTPVIFLAWAPVVFELLYLPALRMIARSSGVSMRAGWIGTALFYCFNWIDQDYFSPQALNLLFFLVIVGCVLAFWKPPPIASQPSDDLVTRVKGSWHQLNTGTGTLGRRRQVAIVVIMLVVMAACVASHQFTPYALATALVSCYLTRRLPGPELPLVLGVMAVGWLSFATVNFWQGHLSLLFGGVGSISNSIGANVSNRIQGSLSHRLIVDLRLVIGAFSIAAAGVGALLRRRESRTLEFLTVTPFGLLLLGSYGGEALLRCFLFSLPFSTLLIGSLLVRPFEITRLAASRASAAIGQALAHRRTAWIGCAAVGLLVAGIIGATTLARGGNDAFESFTTTERAAVVYVYNHAKAGQSVSSTTPSTEQLPWRDQLVGSLHFEAPTSTSSPASIGSSILRVRPTWVIATTNQQWWGELVEGWHTGWQANVVRRLESSGYVVAQTWSDAVVLERHPATSPSGRPA